MRAGPHPVSHERTVPTRAEPRGRTAPLREINPDMSAAQFQRIRDLAFQHAGLSIADFKHSMVLRRIRMRLKALSMPTITAYCALLETREGLRELQPLINALTTNKTSFFREPHHFEHLRSAGLPEILANKQELRQRRIRLWSAGCSTGEEAWSIAATLATGVPAIGDWNVQILATDIDTNVLTTARHGIYRAADAAAVTKHARMPMFETTRNRESVAITPFMRSLVTFKHLNLHGAWPFRGPFDAIFCRNVVIYFNRPAQRALYDRFADALAPDGLLYCGHSESLHGLSDRFTPVGRSIYRRIA